MRVAAYGLIRRNWHARSGRTNDHPAAHNKNDPREQEKDVEDGLTARLNDVMEL